MPQVAADRVIVSVQHPVVIGSDSVPQPDLALLKLRADSYTKSHPTAAEVLLLIEVADSTLAFDLGAKAALYARGGIAELWVVDVQDHSVRVFRDPSPAGYRTSFAVSAAQSVSTLLLPDVIVPLEDSSQSEHSVSLSFWEAWLSTSSLTANRQLSTVNFPRESTPP